MGIYLPSKDNSKDNSKDSKMQNVINEAVRLSGKTDKASVKRNAQLQDYLWK